MMNKDSLTIRSVISEKKKVWLLWRGTALGSVGGFLLLYAGSYWPLERLEKWGILVFFIALFLIAWGLIPYRRLMRRDNNPDTLSISEDGFLAYSVNGNLVYRIPLKEIESIEYSPSPSGITLRVSDHPNPLFFPDFTEKGVRKIRESGVLSQN